MALAMLALVGNGLLPNVSMAEPDFSINASASLARVYDDNIFASSSQAEADRVWRLSPAIEIDYVSAPLTLEARYTQDAEAYARHPDLNTTRARQHAVLDLRHRPTRLLTLSAGAEYITTLTPGELNVDTDLGLGRARAERFSVHPSLEYRLDPVTVGSAAYSFTRDRLAGGITTETQAGELRLSRTITRRDTATLAYTYRRFVFQGAKAAAAHALVAGGTHAFTARTSVALQGGPRYFEGDYDLEVSASLRYALERGEISLAYGRSQATVIGLAGAVNTDAVVIRAAVRPGASLEIRGATRFAHSTRAGFEADAYSFGVEATYRIDPSLAFVGSYQYVRQRGSLDVASDAEMTRRIAMLGLVASAPWTERRAVPADAAAARALASTEDR